MNKRQVQQLKIQETLSPEEILARGRLAKLRFRSAIRFVIQNLYWLSEPDDLELGDDVQKNILVLTRKTGKTSLLSLQDKGILSKRAEYRTEEEKVHLGRILGGLKCFRRYPLDVKNKLSSVSYYYYFGPGRTIVRQGHPSEGLYFILTGNLTVSQDFFDPVLKEMASKDAGTMGPGGMFGDVALLHDIPRASTVTSRTHVELLCLKKEDFNVVLKATVQKQWDAVRNAMLFFSYFDDWDKTIIRDCCILGKRKTFVPNQTILGDGFGYYNHVHFILSGKCQIIEHLFVTSTTTAGRKHYKLYDPSAVNIVSNSNLIDVTLTKEEETPIQKQTTIIEENTGESGNPIASEQTVPTLLDETPTKGQNNETGDERRRGSSVTFGATSLGTTKSTGTAKSGRSKSKGANKFSVSESRRSSRSSGASQLTDMASATKKPSVHSTGGRPSLSKNTSSISSVCLPPNVETYFMQVCFLHPTGCFNIGEDMKHRRVVATTTTECLLIPRYWLVQQSKGNIWNKVRQFLSSHIPTTKQVFKEFVSHKKWLAYRKQLVDDVLSKRKKISNNNINNVPYFIRINEEINIF